METWKAEMKQKPETLVAEGGNILDLSVSSPFSILMAGVAGSPASLQAPTSLPAPPLWADVVSDGFSHLPGCSLPDLHFPTLPPSRKP